MKWIVGYQMREDDAFAGSIIARADEIRELYFSWGDFPNGRSSLSDRDGETLFERQLRQKADLERFSEAGLHFNLLFNGNCYGRDSQSRAFFEKVGNTVDYIARSFGLSSVTTSSILIAKFLRNNFSELDVRASVNMEIGTTEGMEYVSEYFTSYYIKRECNRDLERLRELKAWSDANGKQIYLLANSGCLNNCSAHTFHDNLVAHEAEISKMDNGYEFRGVCWDYLSEPQRQVALIRNTNFIRPEDIALYEEFTGAVKLATRTNRDPVRVLEAYSRGRYAGAVQSLLEPDHSGVLYPRILENSRFPTDFGQKIVTCHKKCSECGYCDRVFEQALIDLGGYTYVDSKDD